VPRDVEPACGDLDGVTLRDIDDLQAVVARNLSSRAAEVPRAEAVIAEEIERFAAWLGQIDVRPTIAALRRRGDQVVEQVLADNAGAWESVSPADLARIEALARSVAGRLLHEPTLRLKSLEAGRGHGSVELLRELFGLPHSVADEGAAGADGQAAGRAQELDNVRPLRSGRNA
jgi:glutamyl-tRNA reductase